ncbi:MAG: hypothetical protein MHM6MM_000070 [Cercozoa sp. M6MM]
MGSLAEFRVLSELGRGSYGLVQKVEHIDSGQHYALKRVDVTRLTEKSVNDQLNEIRLLASMQHGTVVKYIAAFVENNELFIVTELATSSLDAVLRKMKKKRRLPSEHYVWNVLAHTACALKLVHMHGIIHRDVKPANILISTLPGTKRRVFKLADFGCATRRSDRAEDGRLVGMVGTPYYIAPELWQYEAHTPAVDVWALGVICHQLIYGCRPFSLTSKNTPHALMQLSKKVCREPPATSRNGNCYSKQLRGVVSDMLLKNPNERPTVDGLLKLPEVRKILDEDSDILGFDTDHIARRLSGTVSAAVPTYATRMLRTINIQSRDELTAIRLPRYWQRETEGDVADAGSFKHTSRTSMGSVSTDFSKRRSGPSSSASHRRTDSESLREAFAKHSGRRRGDFFEPSALFAQVQEEEQAKQNASAIKGNKSNPAAAETESINTKVNTNSSGQFSKRGSGNSKAKKLIVRAPRRVVSPMSPPDNTVDLDALPKKPAKLQLKLSTQRSVAERKGKPQQPQIKDPLLWPPMQRTPDVALYR